MTAINLREEQRQRIQAWIRALERRIDDDVNQSDVRPWPHLRQVVGGRELWSPLGVLCEVAILGGVTEIQVTRVGPVFTYDSFDTELPPIVRDWIGQNRANPLGRYDLNFENAISEIRRVLVENSIEE